MSKCYDRVGEPAKDSRSIFENVVSLLIKYISWIEVYKGSVKYCNCYT